MTYEKYKLKNRFVVNEAKRQEISEDNVFSYGLSFLDRDYVGILPYELVVIAADSGVGKTAIAVDLAIRNINQGKRIMYFALEGGDEDIHHRITFSELSKRGKFRFDSYRFNLDTDVTDELMGEIYEGLGDLGEKFYVYYYEESLPGMEGILKIMDEMKDEVDMFVVDHLHYINHGDDRDEYKAISNFMEAFKGVTKILRKPVILISHTRGHGQGKRDEPTEYDLHGSSNIVKQADTVIIISRVADPDEYENTDTDRYTEDRFSYTRINVAKSRSIGIRRKYIGPYDMWEKKYIEHEFYKQEKKETSFRKALL